MIPKRIPVALIRPFLLFSLSKVPSAMALKPPIRLFDKTSNTSPPKVRIKGRIVDQSIGYLLMLSHSFVLEALSFFSRLLLDKLIVLD